MLVIKNLFGRYYYEFFIEYVDYECVLCYEKIIVEMIQESFYIYMVEIIYDFYSYYWVIIQCDGEQYCWDGYFNMLIKIDQILLE